MSIGKSNPSDPTGPSMGYGENVSGGSNWQMRNPDTVWSGQAPYLQNMYGNAQNLLGAFSPYQQQAKGIYDTTVGGFEQLMNPGVNPQLEAYSGDVQRNLERNILPTVRGQAGGFGQMGGSRQGVAEGLALGEGNRQISEMASRLYSEDMNRMLQASSMAPGLAQMGMGIPWFGLNQMAGILGRPTVLGGGGAGGGETFGAGFNQSYSAGGGGGGGGFNLGLW